jgi:asparagine synthase (glutamine-hydrolysing)
MRDTMCHRGPDDQGVWYTADRRVGLAHRRLAIIDLSPGGHQPMLDPSGQFCITYNGEIYNYLEVRRVLEGLGHRFRTASDTEVILEAYRAWGIDCLDHLNGMFAFGLYDARKQRLFLARDRAGEKPLFYRLAGGTLTFASELKALMADKSFPRQLDLEALDYYLAFGYVPGEKCILKEVRKLPPAHGLIYDLRQEKLTLWRYWQLPEPPSFSPDESDLIEELANILQDSVHLRLIADVPVGVLLSGGIDSSLVTAMAMRVCDGPVKTFTITFPGYGVYDEGPYARLVASHFGTEHTEMAAEPATVDLLPELARQFDEPLGDSSLVPTYLVSRMVRQHATVALGGDGGDELFGGYAHYSWVQRQETISHFIPCSVRKLIRNAAARSLPPGLKGRNYIMELTADLPHSIAGINTYFDPVSRYRLLAPLGLNPNPENLPELYKVSLCRPGQSPLQQASRVDFHTNLVDDFLVKVDRASMLTSLEVRVPWLDHRLIELAFGAVPDRLRATVRERKILTRRLAQRWLPPQLDLERKQGFSLPLNAWFKGDWGHYIEAVLLQVDPHLFDPGLIQSLISGQRRGYANTNRLFLLTMFELWRQEYQVAVG